MIYASTACLGAPDLWDALDAYAEAGMTSVELGACRLQASTDLDERLDAYGMAFLVHNYFPPPSEPFVLNLASADDRTLKQSRAHVERALELCSAIGSPLYSVHAGFIVDPVQAGGGGLAFAEAPGPDTARAAFERFVESVEIALSSAERLGVRLLVENNVCVPANRGKLLLQTAREIDELFALFPARRLGLLLDTGHLSVTAATFGFDRDEFVERLEARIGGVHAHENDGHADAHEPVASDGWVASTLSRPAIRALPIVAEASLGAIADVATELEKLRVVTGRD